MSPMSNTNARKRETERSTPTPSGLEALLAEVRDALTRAEKAEADLAALRARIETLVDDVTGWPTADGDGWPVQAYEVHEDVRDHLRAILAETDQP